MQCPSLTPQLNQAARANGSFAPKFSHHHRRRTPLGADLLQQGCYGSLFSTILMVCFQGHRTSDLPFVLMEWPCLDGPNISPLNDARESCRATRWG